VRRDPVRGPRELDEDRAIRATHSAPRIPRARSSTSRAALPAPSMRTLSRRPNSSSLIGARPSWPRQRSMFARAPPPAPPRTVTEHSTSSSTAGRARAGGFLRHARPLRGTWATRPPARSTRWAPSPSDEIALPSRAAASALAVDGPIELASARNAVALARHRRGRPDELQERRSRPGSTSRKAQELVSGLPTAGRHPRERALGLDQDRVATEELRARQRVDLRRRETGLRELVEPTVHVRTETARVRRARP
jgi:hypothetical protein